MGRFDASGGDVEQLRGQSVGVELLADRGTERRHRTLGIEPAAIQGRLDAGWSAM